MSSFRFLNATFASPTQLNDERLRKMSANTVGGDSRPVRSSSLAWQTIDDEMVILRVKEKELLGLNDVGGRVWELADGTRSIDQMVEVVAAQYQTPAETARADIFRFIEELASNRLLDLSS